MPDTSLKQLECFGKFNDKSEFCRKYCRSSQECGGPRDEEPRSRGRQILEEYRLKQRRNELNKNHQWDEAREIESELRSLAYATS
jgi:hypothetical protein